MNEDKILTVVRRSADQLEVRTADGERWILIREYEIRRAALQEAIKLATAGAGAERIVDAARSFETFLLGPPDDPAKAA